MSKESNSSSGGISLLGLIFVVFLTLKLVGVINWSWWWITVPLWGGFVIVIALIIFYFMIKWMCRNRI